MGHSSSRERHGHACSPSANTAIAIFTRAPDHTPAPFRNHLHQWGYPYMHRSAQGWFSPFPLTDLSHGFSDKNAKKGVAIQHRNAGLNYPDLSVKVPRHQRWLNSFMQDTLVSTRRRLAGPEQSGKDQIQRRSTSANTAA